MSIIENRNNLNYIDIQGLIRLSDDGVSADVQLAKWVFLRESSVERAIIYDLELPWSLVMIIGHQSKFRLLIE